MMSIGQTQYGQKSKLQLLKTDFQNKLMKEKEERLLKQLQNEQMKQQKTLGKYQKQTENRIDSYSAPGSVRQFFSERKTNPGYSGDIQSQKSNSASHVPLRKRAGYDKSNLLTPINRTAQNAGPTRKPRVASENRPSEFQRWREEQDEFDRQRRAKAQIKRGNGQLDERLTEYKGDVEELEMMQRQETEMSKMLAIQKEEEEREKKEKIKHKQDQKRREQAEIGRRRKEEAEQRRKEATEKRRQQEIDRERGKAQPEEEDQDAMIQRLEEELERKKKDLFQIQTREYDREPSPRENSYANQNISHRSPEADEYFPSKPRKVNRGHYRNKMTPEVVQPSNVLSSPTKSRPNHTKNDLNSTYSVNKSKPKALVCEPLTKTNTRSDGRPLPSKVNSGADDKPLSTAARREQPNEVLDEETGEMIRLVPCSICGRKFNEERIVKHQQACKTATKQRKKFNVTAQRIAGSGAEEFIRKKPAAGTRTNVNKANKGKKDWRKQHDDFIAAIRYAKKAADIEKNGGDITALAPPPKSDTSDYVQCPHCCRKFNEGSAERHIPKCQDIRAKPSMLKKGAGSRR